MRSLLVLWDVDYTLINAGGVGQHLYDLVFRELFGRDLPGMAPVAGRTDRAIILDTLALAGVAAPAQHVPGFLAGMAARAPSLRELAAQRCLAMPGAQEAVAALARYAPGAGLGAAASPRIVQSVLTGNMRALAEVKLGALGLTRYLDLAIGAYGDHHEARAELVHDARRRAKAVYGDDFAGSATVLIGDTPLDVVAALAAGARAVGVATGGSAAGELAAAGAHAVLPDLTDTRAVVAAVTG